MEHRAGIRALRTPGGVLKPHRLEDHDASLQHGRDAATLAVIEQHNCTILELQLETGPEQAIGYMGTRGRCTASSQHTPKYSNAPTAMLCSALAEAPAAACSNRNRPGCPGGREYFRLWFQYFFHRMPLARGCSTLAQMAPSFGHLRLPPVVLFCLAVCGVGDSGWSMQL